MLALISLPETFNIFSDSHLTGLSNYAARTRGGIKRCLRNISKCETFLFIKPTPTPQLSGSRPGGRTPRFPSLTGYDVWMKALSRYNDCTPPFSRARS